LHSLKLQVVVFRNKDIYEQSIATTTKKRGARPRKIDCQPEK
jgi:hypothetical protein